MMNQNKALTSVVSYPERGHGGNNRYRGNCSPKLIEDLITHFRPHEVCDYMCGSNTTADAARAMGIVSHTYDLHSGFDLLHTDIQERPEFIFWHPPYWDIIQYSDVMYRASDVQERYGYDPRLFDLSRIPTWEGFVQAMNYCMMKQFCALEQGGRMAVLVGDIKKKGRLFSMLFELTKPGVLENVIILTLFAIAKELEKSGNISPMVEADLAVGLPPEHYALRQRFADYFKRGRVNFVFNGAPICLMIRHVFVYPQAYAAVVPQAGRLKEIPRTFIIDIGGYTTDVMLLRNAAPDLQFCRSLEMGVIPMSNDIISRVSAMYDIKIEDDHIADIIQGRPTILPQEVREVVFMKVRSYACDILDKLRELQVDLRANPAIFIGGGSILFRSFVEESPLVAHADFVTDPKANAIGYGMLATAQLRRMTPQNHGGEFFAQG